MDVQARRTRKPQPFRCSDCRKDFSVKTDTVGTGPSSKASEGMYISTGLKGTSSMKLHRIWRHPEDGLVPPIVSARHGRRTGPRHETYMGGKEHNKHSVNQGRTSAGTRGRRQVSLAVVEDTTKPTSWSIPLGLPHTHRVVKHSVSQYVRDGTHQRLESFWATLKRGYIGVYHLPKHWDAMLHQPARRLIDQMGRMVKGMEGSGTDLTA